MSEPLGSGERIRVPPPQNKVIDPARVAFRELLDYQRGRSRIGQTILRVRSFQREAHLLTLDDGEHLLIQIEHKRLLYWAGSRDSLDKLHRRACNWLTEAASAAD